MRREKAFGELEGEERMRLEEEKGLRRAKEKEGSAYSISRSEGGRKEVCNILYEEGRKTLKVLGGKEKDLPLWTTSRGEGDLK